MYGNTKGEFVKFALLKGLSKATFCLVFFLVFSFSGSSINCFTELMSANLEAMILGKQGTL